MRISKSTSISRIAQIPLSGAGTDIPDGTLIMKGVTAGTNLTVGIVATSVCGNAIGVLIGKFTASGNDSTPATGVTETRGAVELLTPGDFLEAELINDASNDVDVASATSTVLTVTSCEDFGEGGWVYVRAGTGVGQLLYIKSSTSGTWTIKSASTTTLDSTSKLLVMRPRLYELVEIDSTGVYIKSTAAAGNWKAFVLDNQFKSAGDEGWIQLDPTKHHNLQFGDPATTGRSVQLRQLLCPKDTVLNPLA